MNETRRTRIKRLKMRSMRRGIREMDLILTAYANANLEQMDNADLDVFDSLLNENDQDLYQWVTGQAAGPDRYRPLLQDISQVFQK